MSYAVFQCNVGLTRGLCGKERTQNHPSFIGDTEWFPTGDLHGKWGLLPPALGCLPGRPLGPWSRGAKEARCAKDTVKNSTCHGTLIRRQDQESCKVRRKTILSIQEPTPRGQVSASSISPYCTMFGTLKTGTGLYYFLGQSKTSGSRDRTGPL